MVHEETDVNSFLVHCPNVSTSPITAMVCKQCLSLSVVQLKGKHYQKTHCRNGVVHTFRHSGFTASVEREIWPEVSTSFFQFFLLIDLECLMKTQVQEIRKKITPLCRSTLRTPENNVVKCIKGKNAKKEKVGAPAKTNSIILNRRDGVPRIFAKPQSASIHTARFDLKFTLAFKICLFSKLGN